jgi:hypothetical protein
MSVTTHFDIAFDWNANKPPGDSEYYLPQIGCVHIPESLPSTPLPPGSFAMIQHGSFEVFVYDNTTITNPFEPSSKSVDKIDIWITSIDAQQEPLPEHPTYSVPLTREAGGRTSSIFGGLLSCWSGPSTPYEFPEPGRYFLSIRFTVDQRVYKHDPEVIVGQSG